jgi:hypothetical protein
MLVLVLRTRLARAPTEVSTPGGSASAEQPFGIAALKLSRVYAPGTDIAAGLTLLDEIAVRVRQLLATRSLLLG